MLLDFKRPLCKHFFSAHSQSGRLCYAMLFTHFQAVSFFRLLYKIVLYVNMYILYMCVFFHTCTFI